MRPEDVYRDAPLSIDQLLHLIKLIASTQYVERRPALAISIRVYIHFSYQQFFLDFQTA